MPRCGRKRKKRRTEKDEETGEAEKSQTPRCFVLKRGAVGDRVKDLVHDIREVMMPNTAKKLRESRMNRMEDFIAVAGHFNVSHLMLFTVTKVATWMKLAKLPQGPTLTFRVDSFSLARDVRASQKRPRGGARDYTVAPLQVLNGFGGAGSSGGSVSTELTAEMLRGMFPSVDVREFNPTECRRTALFQYEKEDDKVYFRHYSVAKKTAGLQRGVSKLLRRARLPKLGKCEDISDYILGGGTGASESEMEEAEEVPISGGGRTSIRLVETGPRLALSLVKAEEGVCGGSVIYHRYQTRTPSQREVQAEKVRQKEKLKKRNDNLTALDAGRKAVKRKFETEKDKRRPGAEKAAAKGAGKGKKGKGKDKGKGKGDGDEADSGGEDNGPAAKKQKTSSAGGGEGQDGSADGVKKKRFHPFGWGAKKTREANAGGEKTVDMAASKQGGGSKGGKSGGKGKGKREQPRQSAMERFHDQQNKK